MQIHQQLYDVLIDGIKSSMIRAQSKQSLKRYTVWIRARRWRAQAAAGTVGI
eukprot:COSAG02_NODE_7557_length_2961_cov_9.324948_4_plen_52_part_00